MHKATRVLPRDPLALIQAAVTSVCIALLLTPFTNPKAGQKKFGGWTDEGISFYGNWTTKIKKNRVDNAEYIQVVEELALKRVKAAEEIDEDGDKKPAAKNANGKRLRAQEEEEVDENDFEAW